MSPSEKKKARERIVNLRDDASTNLWFGIREGLQLFSKTELVDNVQGLYVLTDGMPNTMCPKQGYVKKLGPILKESASKKGTIPTIHTFGFGYNIRSELMQSIAEVGNGSYAFIPDAGMIGTAFVHSVANLYSTVGTSATLEIKLSDDIVLESTGGLILKKGEDGHLLELGNLQYGQSRDLVLTCPNGLEETTAISAKLGYKVANGSIRGFQAFARFGESPNLPVHLIQYHLYRAQMCEFLSSLFPLKENGEHRTIKEGKILFEAQKSLDMLVGSIISSPSADSLEVRSLIDDLIGDEPHGQISKALTSTDGKKYWTKWGRHYLSSLLHAHQKQVCNTFKDPGPLLYGKDSPLFNKCRTELDATFDRLPAPKPSRPERVVHTYDNKGLVTGSKRIPHKSVKMGTYNSRSAPCFEGNCLVRMGDGQKIAVKTLKPGMLVWTPTGANPIAAILRTRIRGEKQKLCRIGDLLVTPWHPVQHEGHWVFPSQITEPKHLLARSVYSVLLAPNQKSDSHAIEIGGKVCVTLGHGLVSRSKNDARAHPFFGSYRRVGMALLRLGMDQNQQVRCGGMMRNAKTGLACGFVRPVVGRTVKRTLGLGMKRRCLA